MKKAINKVAIALFWVAFIFTRPFGAAFGDFLTKSIDKGGLALTRGDASIVTLLILGAVLFFSIRAENQQRLARLAEVRVRRTRS